MKLTIFSRLIISYLCIFSLVTVVSVYAIYQLHLLNKGTRQILKVNTPLLDYVEKLTHSTLTQLRYQKKYILTRDTLLYDQFISARADFNKFLSAALSMADTREKKEALGKIQSDFKQFESLTDQEVEYFRKNQPYSKRMVEREIEKSADEILDSLKKLEAYSRQDLRQGMKVLGESASSSRRLVITMSVIAILVLVATSIFLTKSITRPLGTLIDETRVISRGIFECNLKITAPPELAELGGAFNSMCQKLNAMDKMKSDFFATMSHELRTPLTSIKEGISLLQDGAGGAITDNQKKLLGILSEESKRLINLVNGLLDLSKMEAGMMTYHFEQVGLLPLIERTITEMIPLIEAKNISLETMLDDKIPSLRIDSERILQVLRNLIGNAIKFTPEGGRVGVSVQPLNHEVKVSVTDTGPGIPNENLSMIFEKFSQAKRMESNQIKGTGLGLAIVKYIITAHGGKVWAENRPSHGSSFTFVLPA
jgi:two-component system sensor histidine kinase GlrK